MIGATMSQVATSARIQDSTFMAGHLLSHSPYE